MMIRTILPVIAVAAALTLTTPSATAAPGDNSPGQLVAVENLSPVASLPQTGRSAKLTYWTRGPHDSPMISSGAVYVPVGNAPPEGWPVIAWAHGTVGVADHCAPTTAGRSERDIAYLEHWLARGYAIVATDYVGLGTPGVHPYLDGKSAAHSVIDAVRAARAQDATLSARWVVMGQSQGAHAALFTSAMATREAPELDFRGAVATGPPSQMEKLLPTAGPWFPPLPLRGTAAYFAYILDGLRAARPELGIDSYLTPLGRQVLDGIETLCVLESFDTYAGLSVGQLLSRPLADADLLAAAGQTLAVPTVGHDRPIFVAQGTADRDVPPPMTYALIGELTVGGADVRFHPYGTDHSGTMAASLPDSTPFVAGLFAS
ncbi:lipase family protein [Nocardia sp. NPDC058666]|uniref:lipase family protein n=1 Tax=Nocardia sp. NPDC058666 TaxID=3346587 RepID=UPI00364E0048